MDIGRIICALRREGNLTQEDVAFAAGTDAGYLSRIERGDRVPSLALLESIAKALGTKPSLIYEAAENMEQLPTAYELRNTLATDFSDEAVNLRLEFRELSQENRRIAVELLRALKKTQT